ncbi:MAG: hypothetical protein MUC39_02895 [Candidatus Omnitrophica bacterium]|jgi:hypothetical protein|nr:hypothetical protein [Candidatus Omnitrophota bacterium]
MKELTKEQKKIIYLALVIVASLFLFWVIIYIPQKRRLVDIKRKLSVTEAEIEQINRVAQGRPLAEAAKDLNLRLQQASTSFIESGDAVKFLSETAKQFKIDIRNIDPGEETALSANIPGYTVKELPVAIEINCEYRALGDFLDSLRNNSPYLSNVRHLGIQSNGEANPILEVKLDVSLYLLER